MRILHVIPNLVKGGAQRIAVDICRELSQRDGIEVLLIYFDGENEFEYLTNYISIKKIDIRFELSFTGKNHIQLNQYESVVDKFKPDVIHSHLYYAELVSRESPRKNINYFTHCHDNIRQLRRHTGFFPVKQQKIVEFLERRRLLKRYIQCNNHFISIATDGHNYLKKNLPKKFHSSIFLLHNAIDVKSFQANEQEKITKHSLINVGNFISKKNQFFLVDVVSKIKSKGFKIPLTFIGNGTTLTQVKEKTIQLGLLDLVDFKGKNDNVASFLHQNTIYVHSAKLEPFGLVLLEAMAAGLPVVSLDGRGNRDVIKNGKNGFLIKQGDVNGFADAVIRLIRDKSLFKQFREEGLKTAFMHDIGPYTDQLLTLYSKTKN